MKKVLLQRLIAAVMVMAIFHVNMAVAEPTTGMNGDEALRPDLGVAALVDLYKGTHTMTLEASIYNPGDRRQTDNSPCHGPKGIFVCDPNQRIIAANGKFKLGDMVLVSDPSILKYFGETGPTVFTVGDRMNSRFQKNIDFALYYGDSPEQMKAAKADAYKFGRRKIEIVVLEK